MDSATCGPSNAVKNLNNFANQNKLHNSQHHHPQLQRQNQQFRTNNHHSITDHQLNHEFDQFNAAIDHSVINAHHPQHSSLYLNNQQLNIKQHPQYNQGPNTWINDFSGLSIEQQQQQQQQQNQGISVKSDWHQQFIQNQHQNQNLNLAHQPSNQHHTLYQSSYTPLNQSRSFMNQASNPIFAQQSEHQQVHKLDQDKLQHSQFENEFELIEKELNLVADLDSQAVESQSESNIDDLDKEQFAQSARKVENSMKSINTQDQDMNDKFANSSFLKLMNSIGDRRVELEGDKLIDTQTKNDIREESTNLVGAKQQQQQQQTISNSSSNIDYHRPIHTSQAPISSNYDWYGQPLSNNATGNEQLKEENMNSKPKLPDPLAHIKDGDLGDINDPLTAARLISGGQVKPNNWEEDDDWLVRDTQSNMNRPYRRGQIVDHHWDEMYNDYKHDDDFH